ncbi:hypothetical protein IQ247_09770 [Plectonema cf. radiosum LEGE 06105]|uniref:Uncharacterized protein n=1 Tax=Plectonema cf. radiosum LEGE 06105 TaxID=945769 RepID=A0A8J7JSU5_9CYAN|nr:hypothetical protein [Plectonema radiosum]MBE9212969.1 hypothetical protein [Plectonema cf. radiosum LEGE 06105]
MNDDDRRQYLENCLRHEQVKYSSDADSFDKMLRDFESKMGEVIEVSGQLKIGFVRRAKAVFEEGRSQVIENRVQMNEELQRSVIRITGALFALFLIGSAIATVKGAIDNQFCEYFNVRGRTERYETQEPCKQ